MTVQFVFTTHSQYAIILLLVIARCEDWITLAQLTNKTGVSRPYLYYMLGQFCEDGLLEKQPRYRKGYRLAKPAGTRTEYALNSSKRKTIAGEFLEVLIWHRFLKTELADRTLADILATVEQGAV